MMTIVIDERKASRPRVSVAGQFDLAITLKTPVYAPEAGQCRDYGGVGQTHFIAYRDRCERILHVMQSWEVKHAFELARLAVCSYQRGKMHPPFTMADIGGTDLCVTR